MYLVTLGGHKKTSDPIEIDSWVLVNDSVGAENRPGSSVKVTSVLNCCGTSSAPLTFLRWSLLATVSFEYVGEFSCIQYFMENFVLRLQIQTGLWLLCRSLFGLESIWDKSSRLLLPQCSQVWLCQREHVVSPPATVTAAWAINHKEKQFLAHVLRGVLLWVCARHLYRNTREGRASHLKNGSTGQWPEDLLLRLISEQTAPTQECDPVSKPEECGHLDDTRDLHSSRKSELSFRYLGLYFEGVERDL